MLRRGARIALWLWLLGVHAAAGSLALGIVLPAHVPRAELEDPEHVRYHETILGYHLRGDALLPPGRIVLVGDSLVQGMPVGALSSLSVDYGIGGDTTADVLERVPRYGSLGRARAVLIHVGTNDMRRSTDRRMLRRYAAVLDALPAGLPAFCSAVLPVDQTLRPLWPGRSASRIRAYNAKLRSLCTERGARFVSAWDVLADPSGSLRSVHHVGDGLHLNAAGNAVWIERLREDFELAGIALEND